MFSSHSIATAAPSSVSLRASLSRAAESPFAVPLLMLVAALWFILGNGLWPLLNPDEGRYVGVALEMLYAREWGTPLLNGMPYFHKPPMFYWLTAGSLAIFGENEFAARLVPALAGVLMIGSFHAFIKRFVHPVLGLLVGVMLAVTPLMFGATHYANLDLLVATMISTTILCGATAVLLQEQGKPALRWVLAMYLFAGLGFLTKGLIGFVLPGGVLLFWLLAERRYTAIPLLLRISGILLFLAVVLPWLLLMQSHYPGFLHYYLVYQQFDRFAQGGFNNVMPVWFYVAVLLATMIPWMRKGQLFIFSRRYWTQPNQGSVRRLMWIWLLLILVFFSIPQSKLVGYILPVLPPLVYILAEFYAGIFAGSGERSTTKATEVLNQPALTWALPGHLHIRILICVALGIASLVYLSQTHLPSSSQLAGAMTQAPQTPAAVAQDQYYALEIYPFDFRFYRGGNPILNVVSNWDDPALSTKDNWEKELWDAQKFATPDTTSRFVLPADFMHTLCAPEDHRRWILADTRQMGDYPAFKSVTPYAAFGRRLVYLLPAGAVMPFCQPAAQTSMPAFSIN